MFNLHAQRNRGRPVLGGTNGRRPITAGSQHLNSLYSLQLLNSQSQRGRIGSRGVYQRGGLGYSPEYQYGSLGQRTIYNQGQRYLSTGQNSLTYNLANPG